jgi:hypothetical protein
MCDYRRRSAERARTAGVVMESQARVLFFFSVCDMPPMPSDTTSERDEVYAELAEMFDGIRGLKSGLRPISEGWTPNTDAALADAK